VITELTKEQEALMEVVRDEWLKIGLATATTMPKEEAEVAVREAYRCAELEEPKYVYFARGPKEGALAVAVLKNYYENADGTEKMVKYPVKFRKTAANHAMDGLKPMTQKEMTAEVVRLWEIQQEAGKLPERISSLCQDAFQWACYGQHDAGWLSFYDFFERIGVEGLEQLSGLKKAAHSCGWWWAMDECCVITERPMHLSLDAEGRLHDESQMAIRYSDGWGLHCWHGVNVAPYIIETPEKIDVKDIVGEENAEIRRIKIERMGEDKFLADANAKLVDEDTDKDGQPRKLWRVDFENDTNNDPWQGVQVSNSTAEPDGTRHMFVIPVPPNVRTVAEGVAWSFNMTVEEYQPVQES